MEINPNEADAKTIARTVLNSVVPRPIGWISTRNDAGIDNLAPFSYFNAVSSSPPVVMFSAGDLEDGLKDTPENVLETDEFVWNLVTENLVEQMDATSERLDPDRDEFEYSDLERAESVVVGPPRVARSPISFECELFDVLDVYNNTVIFGEVVYAHVSDSVVGDDGIDPLEVDAVGRLGGPYYTGLDVLEFKRGN